MPGPSKRRFFFRGASSLVLAIGLAACDQGSNEAVNDQRSGMEQSGETATEQAQTETQKLMAFFQKAFEEDVARSPMTQAYMGRKTEDYGKWDDLSDEAAAEELAINKARLEALKSFDVEALEPSAKLSYRLFQTVTSRDVESYKWRKYSYPVNQMFGWQQQIPSFLINIHGVTEASDADAYIARLEGVGGLVDQLIAHMKEREDMGIMPPKFVYPIVIEATRNVITGAPFGDSDENSALMDDIESKIAKLDLPEDEAADLTARARAALKDVFGPAYERLIAEMERQEKIATTDDGVWKLPDGADYYAAQLASYTTTDLSADEIHQIGLDNVDRIHGEMRKIMEQVGFEGDLQAFFEFMRTDEQFYYENTDAGRQRYLDEATALIDTMRTRLPEVFGILPKADLVVKRVEPFREKAAGKAFYQQPALDGSRPGTYYANLYDMMDMPSYQMEALAYHEGIPGHHMQLAISQELDGLPMFQKLARFTAIRKDGGFIRNICPRKWAFMKIPIPISDAWRWNYGGLAAWWWIPAFMTRNGPANRPLIICVKIPPILKAMW
ncbi:hypothetical protein JCM17843_24460 [Kordiimonadales bacterium JCM 17843]|nr:hypothetical protein JCM17843_24460 [Kordiimonadales bacterium JCM 17843]